MLNVATICIFALSFKMIYRNFAANFEIILEIINYPKMKKILLSLLLFLFTFMGFTQTLSLSWEHGPIDEGGEIGVLGDSLTVFEIVSEVYVTNNNTDESDSVFVICSKEEVFLVENSVNTFCWGFQCYPPPMYESLDTVWIHAGETNMTSFSGHLNPNGIQGTSRIKYIFKIVSETGMGETSSVYVNYWSDTEGIGDDIDLSSLFSIAYPNPANTFTSFDYSIPQGIGKASIVVHNLLGAVVKEININDREGKLVVNTSDLIEGMYFYTVVIDNETVVSRKLVIKR